MKHIKKMNYSLMGYRNFMTNFSNLQTSDLVNCSWQYTFLDDVDENHIAKYSKKDLSNIEVNSERGSINIGGKEWFYSKKLFDSTESLKLAIKSIIQIVR